MLSSGAGCFTIYGDLASAGLNSILEYWIHHSPSLIQLIKYNAVVFQQWSDYEPSPLQCVHAESRPSHCVTLTPVTLSHHHTLTLTPQPYHISIDTDSTDDLTRENIMTKIQENT